MELLWPNMFSCNYVQLSSIYAIGVDRSHRFCCRRIMLTLCSHRYNTFINVGSHSLALLFICGARFLICEIDYLPPVSHLLPKLIIYQRCTFIEFLSLSCSYLYFSYICFFVSFGVSPSFTFP